MAQQQQQQQQQSDAFWEQLSAPFPPPPPFWKHFSSTNLDRLKDLESQPNFDPSSLPYELLVLRPPPAPTAASSYSTFDQVHSITPKPTFPPEHEELLFDADELNKVTGTARPHARLLWQLTKSLNLNLLELFTIMADNPVDYQDKVNDIGMLMENINSVINLLRPHQAREQLKTMLLNQLDAGKEELERCEEMKKDVEAFLNKVEAEGSSARESGRARNTSNKIVNGHGEQVPQHELEHVETAREKWATLDELEGD